jgi:AraC-like DNA-binding protein
MPARSPDPAGSQLSKNDRWATKMTESQLDRCRFPPTLWRALQGAGLEPPKVLRAAGLPVTFHLDPTNILTTAQLFAVWKAVETMSPAAVPALPILHAAGAAGHQPAFIAALYALNLRDAIYRIERFKRMGASEMYEFDVDGDISFMTKTWPFAVETEPAVSIDLSFLFLLEIARIGTGQRIVPASVQYQRAGSAAPELEAHYGCRIRYGAKHNAISFRNADLAIPFPGHAPEFLALVTPGLTAGFDELRSGSTISERVMAVLKRTMASGRPNIAFTARALGTSERSLQRSLTVEGTTFRVLLAEARKEMSLQLLADPEISVEEVTLMLGFQDATSFYRTFREWEGMSPGEWRAMQCHQAFPA